MCRRRRTRRFSTPGRARATSSPRPRIRIRTPQPPGGPNEQDIVNHPADLRYVIQTLVSAPPAAVSRVLDSSEVAVVGQSDGGDVSLAAAGNTCCRSNAVKAAVILSGAELSSFGGNYFRSTPVPLLAREHRVRSARRRDRGRLTGRSRALALPRPVQRQLTSCCRGGR